MLQVSNKNGNVSNLINESLGSLGEIISNGKINGIYTLRKLIAQEYFYFKDEDIDYKGKNRTVKTLRANQDVDDVSFDVYDAWGLSALVKDYIESMDKIKELQVSKDDLGNDVTKIIGKRKLTGLSLIDLLQKKYINFISMVPEFQPILKDENITGDVILIGINPILYKDVPSIEELVKLLIIESYKYSDTDTKELEVVCFPVDMFSESSGGPAKAVLEKVFKDKKASAELPARIEATNDISELELIKNTCKELQYYEGVKKCDEKINEGLLELIQGENNKKTLTEYKEKCHKQQFKEGMNLCRKKLNKIKELEERKKQLDNALLDAEDYDTVINTYIELKEINEELGNSKEVSVAEKGIQDAKSAEENSKALKDDNAQTIIGMIEYYSSLGDSKFYKNKIDECRKRLETIQTNKLVDIRKRYEQKHGAVVNRIAELNKQIEGKKQELLKYGVFQGQQKRETNDQIIKLVNEVKNQNGIAVGMKNTFDFVSALLVGEIGQTVSMGGIMPPNPQTLKWMLVSRNAEYVVLYGQNIIADREIKANKMHQVKFSSQEDYIIADIYESITYFKKSKHKGLVSKNPDAFNFDLIKPTKSLEEFILANKKEYEKLWKSANSMINKRMWVVKRLEYLKQFGKDMVCKANKDNVSVLVIDIERIMISDYYTFNL